MIESISAITLATHDMPRAVRWLRVQHLVRAKRAPEHAARNHRRAQSDDQCCSFRCQRQGAVCGPRLHRVSHRSRRFRQVHRGGNREVGQSGEVLRREAGVIQTTPAHSINLVRKSRGADTAAWGQNRTSGSERQTIAIYEYALTSTVRQDRASLLLNPKPATEIRSNRHPALLERQDCTLAAWYSCLYAPRTGGAYDSHPRTAGIVGRARRRGGVAARPARTAGQKEIHDRYSQCGWRWRPGRDLGRGRGQSHDDLYPDQTCAGGRFQQSRLHPRECCSTARDKCPLGNTRDTLAPG